MVTLVALFTVRVVTVKLALVFPASTVTLAGTAAALVLLLLRFTTAPPLGAAPLNVTVPCEVLPPTTEVGFTLTEDKLAAGGGGGTGLTVSEAARVTPPNEAEIVAVLVAATETVLMVKLAVVAPARTVTLGGVEATPGLLLESVTSTPPLGAALLNVTVPCEVLPPTTEVGFTLTEDKLAAGGAAWAVIRREAEKGPATPAELMPRTRHQSCWAGKPVMTARDSLTIWLKVNGAVKLLELSI
jgi:hypothetical protein